jgi:hypothetical protein
MLIVMAVGATREQVAAVTAHIEALGLKAHPIPGAQRVAIGITGNLGVLEPALFETLQGVLEVIPVSHPYKLVSREVKPDDSVVHVGGVPIGGGSFGLIAGPCSVENPDQALTVARAPELTSCAAERSSRERLPTRSRAWGAPGWRSSATSAAKPECRWCRRRSTRSLSTSSSSTAT